MSDVFEITHCEVCGNEKLHPVLDLGPHPMCDDLVPVGDNRVCRDYPIEILYCANCVTAHQRFQVPKQTLFPKSYHYRARFTADVLTGMSQLVDACEKKMSLQGKKVIDIGCNDGSLLNFFKAKGSITIGIEPTNACLDARKNGHDVFNAFLSKEVAEDIVKKHGKPDVITFTNVFAHIENLTEVLDALKVLMSSNTMLVVENHYLGAVLDRNQFDTFYHEHPRSYSYTSFLHIAKNLNTTLNAVEFPSRYGGNIRVFFGGKAGQPDEALLKKEQQFLQQFVVMKSNIAKWLAKKGEIINSLKKNQEKLAGKAFPGRAAILIKMLGIDETIISAVYEKPGSMKIGNYIPGTRIPIRSDDTLFENGKNEPKILNFAWHISSEIKSYLQENGIKANVIDILEQADFA